MGRKSISRRRKAITPKVNTWLRVLLQRLQHEDLEQLTMDDLARIAGKSKSTLYEYFETKEDILVAACRTKTDDLSRDILKATETESNTVQLYTALVQVFAEGTEDITIAFLQRVKKDLPQAWSVIDEFTDQFVELLKQLYKQGISEGIYNDFSVDLLGYLDKHFVIQVVTNPALFTDADHTVSKLVKDYLNLRLTGLLIR